MVCRYNFDTLKHAHKMAVTLVKIMQLDRAILAIDVFIFCTSTYICHGHDAQVFFSTAF